MPLTEAQRKLTGLGLWKTMIGHAQIGGYEKSILETLLRFADWGNIETTEVSIPTLARSAGWADNTVRKYLDVLEERGIIQFPEGRSKGGPARPHKIRLVELAMRSTPGVEGHRAGDDDAAANPAPREGLGHDANPAPREGLSEPNPSPGAGEPFIPVRQTLHRARENPSPGAGEQTHQNPDQNQTEGPASSSMEVGLAGEELAGVRLALARRVLRVVFGVHNGATIDDSFIDAHHAAQTMRQVVRVTALAMHATDDVKRITTAINWLARELDKAQRGEREPVRSPAGLLLTVLRKYTDDASVPHERQTHQAQLQHELDELRAIIGGATECA